MNPRTLHLSLLILLLLACLPGCQALPATAADVSVTLVVDGKQIPLQVPPGTTAQIVLEKAGVQMNTADRLTPPGYTPLTQGATVQVIRVREVFEVKENVIPFERQTVRNESLPEGQTLMIQPGVNGLQQVTFRRVYEDEKEVSNGVFKTVTVTEPRPEVVMVGVQKPFTPQNMSGKLVYLAGGNAWMMEKNSGNRRPLVTTGDLDGRVFTLSPDGSWLLFTRKASAQEKDLINSLWMVDLREESPHAVGLKINNIIHFAAWVPGETLTITYSTVEPRPTAPGWQANNDLHWASFSPAGVTLKHERWLDASSGGIYGWWGTQFAWSPDGKTLAYARPDGVGLVDLKRKEFSPLVGLLPYQTRADWAWVPGLAWAPTSNTVYFTNHLARPGQPADETSPLFDLDAILTNGGPFMPLAPQSGMFAYPAPSPLLSGSQYQVVFLQAIFPEQSETSRYRLVLMDRDGSNRRVIFPSEGMQGLEPQRIVWGPYNAQEGAVWLALMYQGNLWFYDTVKGTALQVTGDGLISRVDWK